MSYGGWRRTRRKWRRCHPSSAARTPARAKRLARAMFPSTMCRARRDLRADVHVPGAISTPGCRTLASNKTLTVLPPPTPSHGALHWRRHYPASRAPELLPKQVARDPVGRHARVRARPAIPVGACDPRPQLDPVGKHARDGVERLHGAARGRENCDRFDNFEHLAGDSRVATRCWRPGPRECAVRAYRRRCTRSAGFRPTSPQRLAYLGAAQKQVATTASGRHSHHWVTPFTRAPQSSRGISGGSERGGRAIAR